MREASWDEALDLVAGKLREQWLADKSRIAFWGSGQQPIVEGYCTSKFWKAGLLSNNIECNARLCMASAVVAFMNVFQTDEPAGCYTDLDEADVFVTWGANMPRRTRCCSAAWWRASLRSGVRFYDLTTLSTRTSDEADKVMIFNNNGDLAIANAIVNYLVQNGLYDVDFVRDHLQFKQATEDIGNPTEDGYDKSDIGKKLMRSAPSRSRNTLSA